MICLRRSDLLATALLTSVGAVGTDKLSVSANLHRSLYLTLAICSLNVTSRGQDGKSQATEVYPCAKPLGDGLRRMEHHAYPQFTALLTQCATHTLSWWHPDSNLPIHRRELYRLSYYPGQEVHCPPECTCDRCQ